MTDLSQFIAKEKLMEVEYPTIDGFKIQIVYIAREQIQKLFNQSSMVKFSKITHQREETTDNEKFLRLFTEKTIRGWSGLTRKALASLVPVEDSFIIGHEAEEVEYSPENALTLISNSTDFDRFINDTLRNVEEFNLQTKKTTIKN